MDYDFAPYLRAVEEADWFRGDEPLLRELRARLGDTYASAERELAAEGLAAKGLGPLVEEASLPENAPRLVNYDGHGHRVDDVVLPGATRRLHAQTLGRGLGTVHGDPLVHYARVYLYAQNGEGGFHCAAACTDGMERALRGAGEATRLHAVWREIVEASPEHPTSGAQFVTEAQGGSDVASNRVTARKDGDSWRLRGQKWFCSNIVADWFLVTARPTDAPDGPKGVGLFAVPAHRSDGTRNGYRIERLKDKLGTRELPTAEVDFDDALGWPVCPTDRGLATVVGTVLTTSRIHCILAASAALARARREATAYARFRTAFGRPIFEFPLVADALEGLAAAHARAVAMLFALLDLWPRNDDASKTDFRVLLSLAKPVITRSATAGVREAMALLAGNGIEERFSSLPRLFRDCVITETWEGAHFTLLAQAHDDMRRFGVGVPFVERWAGPGPLASELPSHLAASQPTPEFSAWGERFVVATASRLAALACAPPRG